MALNPHPTYKYEEFSYIEGDREKSIANWRIDYLGQLNDISGDTMLMAFKDPEQNMWTKHLGWYKISTAHIRQAYDIHRNIIWNEIVVESDYPTYEQNYEAARIIGAILEDKGFIPHYYYSGSKSIHMHIFIDFKQFCTIDAKLQDEIILNFTKSKFVKDFMLWLRIKISKLWNLKEPLARETDEQVSSAKTHMIRAELSKNKLGYKTFLGYSYKDISAFPLICNIETKFYPAIGEIRFSKINSPQELIEEFLHASAYNRKKKKVVDKSRSLFEFFNPTDCDPNELKPCVQFILGPNFKVSATDGFRRASFILANELVAKFGKETALARILEWNNVCGSPLRVGDLEYQCGRENHYTLTHDYVHKYLESLGFREEDYHPKNET